MYFRSKRAADLASSRSGLVQSGSLCGIVELDKTARKLGDVDYLHHSASEDEDLNDELDMMVLALFISLHFLYAGSWLNLNVVDTSSADWEVVRCRLAVVLFAATAGFPDMGRKPRRGGGCSSSSEYCPDRAEIRLA